MRRSIFRFEAVRRSTARLLLTLGLLPTGPVVGLGMAAPGALGIEITELAPALGPHVSVTRRATSLELAREATREAWRGLSSTLGEVALPMSSLDDEAGNRISQSDANGHVTRFEFDSVGRQTKRLLPVGAEERFSYDAAGNRISRKDFLGRRLSARGGGRVGAWRGPTESCAGASWRSL